MSSFVSGVTNVLERLLILIVLIGACKSKVDWITSLKTSVLVFTSVSVNIDKRRSDFVARSEETYQRDVSR
jgi:hypothetical protein